MVCREQSLKECNFQTLRDAACTYHSLGYRIISLKPKSKEAENPGWNSPQYWDDPIHWESPGCRDNNIGMPLGRNGFFVIDIDNRSEYRRSVKAIEDRLVQMTGVDTMFWESETIGISSGRKESEKYLFRIPAGFASCMKYRRINWYNRERVYHSVVEFRCGDGFQDVMPPSIHPSGTRYQFTNGDSVLEMPDDLLCLACNWKLFSESLLEVNPDYVRPVTVRSNTGKVYEGEDYAQMWCEKESLPDWLVSCGYRPAGGNRFLSPHSRSGSPGIVIFDGGRKFWSHGSSDPFCDGSPHSAYDLLVHYKCHDSHKEAWKYVLRNLGINKIRNMKNFTGWE